MKEIIVFILIFLAISVQAQKPNLYEKYVNDDGYTIGYVVDNKGNEIEGLMKKNDYVLSTVVLFTKEGVEKRYTPADLRSYNLNFKNYVSDGHLFYELVHEGKVGFYQRSIFIQAGSWDGGPTMQPGMPPIMSGGNREKNKIYFCKAGTQEFIEIKNGSFKSQLSKFFADCEILKTKIKKGELTVDDLDLIRYIYNNDCKE